MLEFVKGDLFEIPADIRVNTVNCVGVMGAGVALAFKQRYPDMFKAYQRDCKDGRVTPGKMHIWKSLSGDWIINFPTKRDWREPSRYEDIEAGLDDLRIYLDEVGPLTIALPALGCGNGGLDWARVSDMIRDKLDGVDAHVLVFEPAASRQAGREAMGRPTEDERQAAQLLGYQIIEPSILPDMEASAPLYVLGRPDLLSHKWIALLPSRNPGEREMDALRAIAAELCQSDTNRTVAIVYGSLVSEELANTFIGSGVNTVLLLPFGVLSKKTLSKQLEKSGTGLPTLVSGAGANSKWSHQLFAQAMDMLRANASVTLLSDPEPDWLSSKNYGKWARTPITYIRYETMPPKTLDALANFGALPMGRRGANGAPNIGHLLSPLEPTHSGHKVAPEPGDPEGKSGTPRLPPASIDQPEIEHPTEVVTIAWDSIPISSQRELFETLEQLGATNMAVSCSFPSSLSDADRKRLRALSQNKKE